MTESNQQGGVSHAKDTKAVLREEFLAVRNKHRNSVRQAANQKIRQRLLLLLSELRIRMRADRGGATPVAGLYCAVRGEVDVAPLAGALRAEDWRTAFPVTRPAARSIEFHLTDDSTAWERGAYGILEPRLASAAALPVEPANMSAIVVPGLAFTASGGRLGYGGGYYDRWFAVDPAGVGPIRIGVAYQCQLAPELPLSDHDVRMHYVVTENGVIPCQLVH